MIYTESIQQRNAEMIQHLVQIQSIGLATHNVLRVVCEKPSEFPFLPGQYAGMALDREGWRDNVHPFSMCSLPQDDHLEFYIKTYPARKGFTNELLSVQAGQTLLLHPAEGTLLYRGEGTFISGGTGLTPFLAIIRDLHSQHRLYRNRLICANNLREDIICADELQSTLGKRCVHILADESANGFLRGRIDADTLTAYVSDFELPVYVCGPTAMVSSVSALLLQLGLHKSLLVVEGGS